MSTGTACGIINRVLIDFFVILFVLMVLSLLLLFQVKDLKLAYVKE